MTKFKIRSLEKLCKKQHYIFTTAVLCVQSVYLAMTLEHLCLGFGIECVVPFLVMRPMDLVDSILYFFLLLSPPVAYQVLYKCNERSCLGSYH